MPIIEHDYFYEGGPLTREFTFPLSDHERKLLTEWSILSECWGLEPGDFSPERLRDVWSEQQTTSKYHHDLSSRTAHAISKLVFYSVLTFEQETFLVFRSKLYEQTQYKNCILIPVLKNTPGVLDSFPMVRHPEIYEFLQYFRGISFEIPPWTFPWGEQHMPRSLQFNSKLVRIEDLWESIISDDPSWEDAFVCYGESNGSTYLATHTGNLGVLYAGARKVEKISSDTFVGIFTTHFRKVEPALR